MAFVSVMNVLFFIALILAWYWEPAQEPHSAWDTIFGQTNQLARDVYLDLSIALMSVLLTGVTIVLALAAFFAYFDIRSAAEQMASTTAERTVTEVLAKMKQSGHLDDFEVSPESAAERTTGSVEVPEGEREEEHGL